MRDFLLTLGVYGGSISLHRNHYTGGPS